MTESRHLSDNLMSLHPSAGFMSHPTTTANGFVTQANPSIPKTLKITIFSCPRSNHNITAHWRAKSQVSTSDTFGRVNTSDPETHIPKGKRRTTRKESCRTWSFFSVVPAQRYTRYSGYGGVHFICRVPRAPRTRLPQASVRHGTATIVSQQMFNSLAAFPAAQIRKFQFAWPVLSSLPPSCVRCNSSPKLSSSCCFHSQQPQRIDDSVCTQCLGADVGGVALTIHLHQWEALLLNCFLAPECLISICFTGPDSRLVIMPRTATESLCACNGSGQPISVRNCCS